MDILFFILFFVLFFLPIVGFLIYSVLHPEDTVMWGKRWQFKNSDLEPSDASIELHKLWSIISLIVLGTLFVLGVLVYFLQRS